jgi:hypothetical protein
MIKAPDCLKRFHSAKARFLEGGLNIFFKREFPKLLGPILRRKLVEELIKLLQDILPLKEHVKPGQIVWNENPGRFTQRALCSGNINYDK